MKLYKNGWTVEVKGEYPDGTPDNCTKVCPNRRAADKQLGYFLGWYAAHNRRVLSTDIHKEVDNECITEVN